MKRNRGVVFVSVLLVMVVVAMVTAAFLVRSRGTLFGAASYRDGVRAEQAARGGVNHLIAILESDRNFTSDLEVQLEGATYNVTFDPNEPHFSVNNLSKDVVADQLSCQGHKVAPHSADLVVVGHCGQSRRALRVVVQNGMSSIRSIAAVGQVNLSGEVTVDGVKSLVPPANRKEPEPAPGGIVSKYRTTSSTQPAINWTSSGSSDFSLGELSYLETAPADSGLESISSNLKFKYPDRTIEQGAADAIPEIDVVDKVMSGMASPSLSGGAVQFGYIVVKDERSFSGDLAINGDLVLNQGTLYVDGNLTIDGGIEGLGGLFVRGNITVRGGNTVVQTSQPTGVAIMAGGDIRLEGLDLKTYLDTIATTDPAFSHAVSNLKNELHNYEIADASSLAGVSRRLGKTRNPGGVSWINPYPSPDGTFNFADSTGAIPAVARHAKAYALAHPSDPRAAKVVMALEELQYFFRDNLHNVRVNHEGEMVGMSSSPPYGPPAVPTIPLLRLDDYQLGLVSTGLPIPPSGGSLLGAFDYPPNSYLGMGWDDVALPPKSFTHDHIHNFYPVSEQSGAHEARRKAFLLYNPSDLSWLGQSSLQGIVYSGGNIYAETNFRVIGSLISLGRVTLINGSTLIFNEEYRSLLGSRLPLGIVHVEEI